MASGSFYNADWEEQDTSVLLPGEMQPSKVGDNVVAQKDPSELWEIKKIYISMAQRAGSCVIRSTGTRIVCESALTGQKKSFDRFDLQTPSALTLLGGQADEKSNKGER